MCFFQASLRENSPIIRAKAMRAVSEQSVITHNHYCLWVKSEYRYAILAMIIHSGIDHNRLVQLLKLIQRYCAISVFSWLLKEGFVILLYLLEKQHLNLLVGILPHILMLVQR